jgi:hypothetical protein
MPGMIFDMELEVEPGSLEKVDISRILIQRVDGSSTKARVSSMEAANNVLERWANGIPEDANDRCDFQIVFEDGFRYRGRYRLHKSDKRISLARHVRKQLAALAKKNGSRKCTQGTQEDCEPAITPLGENIAESARLALEHYNI